MITKIISGAQSGVDRAVLDFALRFNIPHGGWIPKGRIAEDGPLPDKYQLQEMPTSSYPKRTEQNVNDVFKILDMAYKIHTVDQIRNLEKLPKTVDEAVEKLIKDLPLKDKTTIAKMAEKDLMTLQITLGSYIGSEFGVWTNWKYRIVIFLQKGLRRSAY